MIVMMMMIMKMKEIQNLFIYPQRAKPRKNSGREVLPDESTHFRFQACTDLWARGLPLSFSQRAIEILRAVTKLSILSCYFLSLSDFVLNISMMD